MPFDFRAVFLFIAEWFTTQTSTPRRIIIILCFLLFYPLLQALIWSALLFDRVFFHGYRQQKIASPVFITGMFRSGTTFLHRLMAKDQGRFSTMMMWEILLSPSITQRRVVDGMAKLLSYPVHFLLNRIDRRWAEANKMHKVSLREPEEDDYLLLHIWSAFTTGFSAGLLDSAEPYVRFDHAISESRRRRIFGFYRKLIQRHLFVRAPTSKQYLAKNPALCPKLASLDQSFPDAKIIYLVRSPLEVIPSFYSMMLFSWRIVGVDINAETARNFLFSMVRHWYDYPLEYLATLPRHRHVIVNYDDLVSDPERIISDIYAQLEMPISPEFLGILKEENDKARGYKSQHEYSLDALGLCEAEILEKFQDIFDRFGFAPPATKETKSG